MQLVVESDSCLVFAVTYLNCDVALTHQPVTFSDYGAFFWKKESWSSFRSTMKQSRKWDRGNNVRINCFFAKNLAKRLHNTLNCHHQLGTV